MGEIKTTQDLYNDLVNRKKTNNQSVPDIGAMNAIGRSEGKVDLSSYTPYSSNDVYKTLSDGTRQAMFTNSIAGTDNNERFAQNQSTSEKWANGVTKFLGKTASAVVGGTAGIVYGAGSAFAGGNVYDNKFSNWLSDLDTKMQYQLPNYYTKQEENAGVFGQMTQANFWADKFLGGLAFTGGAIISEAIWGWATGGTSLATAGARIGGKLSGLSKLARGGKWGVDAIGETAVVAALAKNKSLFTKGLDFGTDALNLTDDALKARKWAVLGGQIGQGTSIVLRAGRSAGYEASVEALQYKKEAEENFYRNFERMNGREPDSEEISNFNRENSSTANTVFGVNTGIVSLSNFVGLGHVLNLRNPINMGINDFISKKAFGYGIDATTNMVTKGTTKQLIVRNAFDYLVKPAVTEGLFEEGLQGVTNKTANKWIEHTYNPKHTNQNFDQMDAFYDAMQEQYGTEKGWKDNVLGMIIGVAGGSVNVRGAQKAKETELELKASAGRTYNSNTMQAMLLPARIQSANREAGFTEQANQDEQDGKFASAQINKIGALTTYANIGFLTGETVQSMTENVRGNLDAMTKDQWESAGVSEENIEAEKTEKIKEFENIAKAWKTNKQYVQYIVGNRMVGEQNLEGTKLEGIFGNFSKNTQVVEALAWQLTVGEQSGRIMDDVRVKIGEELGTENARVIQTITDLQNQPKAQRKEISNLSKIAFSNRTLRDKLTQRIVDIDKAGILTEPQKLSRNKLSNELIKADAKLLEAEQKLDKIASEISATKNYQTEIGGVKIVDNLLTGTELLNLDTNVAKFKAILDQQENLNPQRAQYLKDLLEEHNVARDMFMQAKTTQKALVSKEFRTENIDGWLSKLFKNGKEMNPNAKDWFEDSIAKYSDFKRKLIEGSEALAEQEEAEQLLKDEIASGTISPETLQAIADKTDLTKAEQEIYNSNKQAIDELRTQENLKTKPKTQEQIEQEKVDALEVERAEALAKVEPADTVEEINPLQSLYDKLDKLQVKFVKNGKTEQEADSLALASLSEEERQKLRDSYSNENTTLKSIDTSEQEVNIVNLNDLDKLTEEQKTKLKADAKLQIDKLSDDLFFLTHLTANSENLNGIVENGLITGVAIESTTNVATDKKALLETIEAIIDGKVRHRDSSNLAILGFSKGLIPFEGAKKADYTEAVSNFIAENYVENFGKSIPAQYNIATFSNGKINVLGEQQNTTTEQPTKQENKNTRTQEQVDEIISKIEDKKEIDSTPITKNEVREPIDFAGLFGNISKVLSDDFKIELVNAKKKLKTYLKEIHPDKFTDNHLKNIAGLFTASMIDVAKEGSIEKLDKLYLAFIEIKDEQQNTTTEQPTKQENKNTRTQEQEEDNSKIDEEIRIVEAEYSQKVDELEQEKTDLQKEIEIVPVSVALTVDINEIEELNEAGKTAVIITNGLTITENVQETDAKKIVEDNNNTVIETTIEENVSDEEIKQVAQEEGVSNDEAKEKIKEETKKAIKNGGKVSNSISGGLKSIVSKIVKFLLGGALALTLFYNSGNVRNSASRVVSDYIVEQTVVKSNVEFKTSTFSVTSFDGCNAYVSNQIKHSIGKETFNKIGYFGDAWTATGNMVRAGNGKFVFNLFDGYVKKQGLTKDQITQDVKTQLLEKYSNVKLTDFQEGDVVNLFYEGSNFTEQGYENGKDVYTTHVGIVKRSQDGKLVLEHNIHGIIKQDSLEKLLNQELTSVKGKLLVSAVARPNFSKFQIAVKTTEDSQENQKPLQKASLGVIALLAFLRKKKQNGETLSEEDLAKGKNRITEIENQIRKLKIGLKARKEEINKKRTATKIINKNNTSKEVISDEDFNDFTDNNTISDAILQTIANKIKSNSPLSVREVAIYSESKNAKKVEGLLKKKLNPNTRTQEQVDAEKDKINKDFDKKIEALKPPSQNPVEQYKQRINKMFNELYDDLDMINQEDLEAERPTEKEIEEYRKTPTEALKKKLQNWLLLDASTDDGYTSIVDLLDNIKQHETQIEEIVTKEQVTDDEAENLVEKNEKGAGNADAKDITNISTEPITYKKIKDTDKVQLSHIKAEYILTQLGKEYKHKRDGKYLDVPNAKDMQIGDVIEVDNMSFSMAENYRLEFKEEDFKRRQQVLNLYVEEKQNFYNSMSVYSVINGERVKSPSQFDDQVINREASFNIKTEDELELVVDDTDGFNKTKKGNTQNEFKIYLRDKNGNIVQNLKSGEAKYGDPINDDFANLRLKAFENWVATGRPDKMDLGITVKVTDVLLAAPELLFSDGKMIEGDINFDETQQVIIAKGYVQNGELTLDNEVGEVSTVYVGRMTKNSPELKIPIVVFKLGVNTIAFPITMKQKATPIDFEGLLQGTPQEVVKKINQAIIDNNIKTAKLIFSDISLTPSGETQFSENAQKAKESFENNTSFTTADTLAQKGYKTENLVNDATIRINLTDVKKVFSAPKLRIDIAGAVIKQSKDVVNTSKMSIDDKAVNLLNELDKVLNPDAFIRDEATDFFDDITDITNGEVDIKNTNLGVIQKTGLKNKLDKVLDRFFPQKNNKITSILTKKEKDSMGDVTNKIYEYITARDLLQKQLETVQKEVNEGLDKLKCKP